MSMTVSPVVNLIIERSGLSESLLHDLIARLDVIRTELSSPESHRWIQGMFLVLEVHARSSLVEGARGVSVEWFGPNERARGGLHYEIEMASTWNSREELGVAYRDVVQGVLFHAARTLHLGAPPVLRLTRREREAGFAPGAVRVNLSGMTVRGRPAPVRPSGDEWWTLLAESDPVSVLAAMPKGQRLMLAATWEHFMDDHYSRLGVCASDGEEILALALALHSRESFEGHTGVVDDTLDERLDLEAAELLLNALNEG